MDISFCSDSSVLLHTKIPKSSRCPGEFVDLFEFPFPTYCPIHFSSISDKTSNLSHFSYISTSFLFSHRLHLTPSQFSHTINCMHCAHPECPEGLGLAGWQEHCRTWAFVIWFPPRRTVPRRGWTRLPVPPHHRDTAWSGPRLRRVDQPLESCWMSWQRWGQPRLQGAGSPSKSGRTGRPLRIG